MLYRKFGKTNEAVSVLGFGCMRLPVIDDIQENINEEEAIKMIRYAIDNGVNYLDTAYIYHCTTADAAGSSEPLLAKALKDGYRERVKIATKLPVRLVQSEEDLQRFLDEQLERLETESIDFYLLHGLYKNAWEKLKKLGIYEFLDNARRSGKIKYAGFSSHEDTDIFIDIIDSYDWSFCQMQYNYLDENYQAGKKGLEYAYKKGLGVAVMEPLRGGNLVNKLPQEILGAWDSAPVKRTPAEWGLRWVMNHPEVSVVLSGMSEMNQVIENISIANEGAAGSLTEEELKLVDYAKNTLREKRVINCTGCRYCMPCPNGVDIPKNFSLYNDAFLMGFLGLSKARYERNLSDEAKASGCIRCGECEKLCPQKIAVREELMNVQKVLEN